MNPRTFAPRQRVEPKRIPWLIPNCDRCGRYCHPIHLQHDGLGEICPGCFRGAA